MSPFTSEEKSTIVKSQQAQKIYTVMLQQIHAELAWLEIKNMEKELDEAKEIEEYKAKCSELK